MSAPNFSVIRDVEAYSVSASNFLQVPFVSTLENVQRPGELTAFGDELYLANRLGIPQLIAGGLSSLESAGSSPNTVSIYQGQIGDVAYIKGLVAGPNITLTATADDIIVSALAGASTSVISVATGQTLLASPSPAATVKGIVAGAGILATSNSTDVTVSANIASVGAGISLLSTPSSIKSVVAGQNITVTSNLSELTISAAPQLTVVSDAGTTPGHISILSTPSSTKGINAGANVTITDTATDFTISSGLSNLTDAGVDPGKFPLVVSGTGPNLSVKALVPGTGITLSSTATDITISANAITLSDVGTGTHTSLVSNGTGPNLSIKGLSASPGVTLTDVGGNVNISAPNNNLVVDSVMIPIVGTAMPGNILSYDGTNLVFTIPAGSNRVVRAATTQSIETMNGTSSVVFSLNGGNNGRRMLTITGFALVFDGVSIGIGTRVLIRLSSNPLWNGIYYLESIVGNVKVLQLALDAYAINPMDIISVSDGYLNKGAQFVVTSSPGINGALIFARSNIVTGTVIGPTGALSTNTYVGENTGGDNQANQGVTSVGYFAGAWDPPTRPVGPFNATFLGAYAGYNAAAFECIYIGYGCGRANGIQTQQGVFDTPIHNIGLGNNLYQQAINGSFNILMATNSGAAFPTTDHCLVIVSEPSPASNAQMESTVVLGVRCGFDGGGFDNVLVAVGGSASDAFESVGLGIGISLNGGISRAVMVGAFAVSGSNGVAIGDTATTTSGVAIGQAANSQSGISLGLSALSVGNGIAIGPNSRGNQGIAIGEMSTSNVITTTSLGWSAGKVSLASAINNSFYGYASGISVTSGTQNSAYGSQSLYWNNTGINNCAYGFNSMGWNAGLDVGRVAAAFNNNSCFGQNTMLFQRSGDFNSVVGVSALRGSTPTMVAPILNTANSNVAFGAEAMNWVQTATNNVGIGRDTLKFAGTAVGNTATGYQSMFCNATYNITNNVSSNSAYGFQSLYPDPATAVAATMSNNAAFGYQTMFFCGPTVTNGSAFGANTFKNVTGTNNSGFGANVGATLTNGTGNTLLGASANVSVSGAIDRIAIGRGVTCSTDSTAAIGAGSTTWLYASSGGVGVSGNVTSAGFYSLAPAVTKNGVGTPAAYALTAAEFGPGMLVTSITPGATAETYNLPSAVNIVARMPGAVVNSSYYWNIRNEGGNTITLVAGVGVSFGTGLTTIPTLKSVIFKVTITSATTVVVQRFLQGDI